MEDYEVSILPIAQGDLRYQLEDIAEHSRERAMQLLDSIVDASRVLKKTPGAQPLAKDLQFRLRGYRTLSIGNFVTLFTVTGKTVEIHRILFKRPQYEGII